MTKNSTPTRRQFLQLGGAAALACAASTAASAEEPQPAAKGQATKSAGKTLNLGLAFYTFRAFNLDKTLAQAKQAGLKNICLKSVHLPLSATPEELAAIAAKVAEAGLTLYGGGVIDMSKARQGRHRGHGQGPVRSTRPRRDRYPRAVACPGGRRLQGHGVLRVRGGRERPAAGAVRVCRLHEGSASNPLKSTLTQSRISP